jgi:glycosyltransferase involved in cell wall biosynthesis
MPRRTIGIMGRLLDQDDGLGVYSQRLVHEILSLDRSTRYIIFLMSEKSWDLFREFPNAEPYVMPARRKLYWDQISVPAAARKFDVDLIFNPKFSVPLFTRRPCIFVLQGSDWYVNPSNYPWWDNLYIRVMLPLYSWKAARTLAISQATLDDLAKYTNIDVSRSVVTYAGVGPNFSPDQDQSALAQFRTEHKLPEHFILTVARAHHGAQRKLRMYPGGNNERLIRAYRLYREQGGTLPLVVVGFRIEEYLRAHGFTDDDLKDVIFVGFVPNHQVHLAYQAAACFLLATLCESFGITILEALATACPAIVPATCASPEIAGGAARLIDPLDEQDMARALSEVTSSEELRRQMREKGLKRAQELTWRETARLTLAVFDQVVPATAKVPGISSPEAFQPRLRS